jgi:hypothetical protein
MSNWFTIHAKLYSDKRVKFFENIRVLKVLRIRDIQGHLNFEACAYIFLYFFFWGGIFYIFSYYIQHGFICRPSDSTGPSDAGIEPRTVATGALAVRCFNHLARSHPLG